MRRALEGIRTFVASKSCYDILPESFRLIVFDTKLGITKSLQALVTNGVVSAPLYDSTTHRFAGMFTLADVVHLIQYYYLTAHKYENVIAEVEAFQLESLREIEQAIDVPPPPTISVHPDQPLADACAALVRTHARRLPLVDRDDQTGKETIISVLTQYRVLKFIAINVSRKKEPRSPPAASLGVSDRFWPLSTATMQTSVFDVVHVFSERGISAVPIVDEDGVVLNLFETVDIVDLVRQNAYQVLDQTIEDALNQRSPDFTGVMTCTPADSLASILAYVRDRRCHRFVIVEPEDVPARDGMPARKKGSLVGLLSLSDVLRFIVGHENLKGMEVPGLGELFAFFGFKTGFSTFRFR
ncbi:hypothetical protein RHOSPDRAFT_15668 [Rhodotorula sp. JG-1b]|nr:hypothetical protein RHOSPDRAFT_15668 [Rhodotorula sp. JG-1b]